ncbi:hypothetical protein LLG46_10500 [bacterium]|nr:hypothetical protein [bacterium]
MVFRSLLRSAVNFALPDDFNYPAAEAAERTSLINSPAFYPQPARLSTSAFVRLQISGITTAYQKVARSDWNFLLACLD